MLRVVPDGWFSYDFTVFDRSGTPIAQADLANWRETAKLKVRGTHYEAHHKGWRSKEFVLVKEDGRVVTLAGKPSAWKDRLIFEHSGSRYELRKESAWRSAFILSRDGVGLVGSIWRKGFFKREWTADLPEELPLEVRVFVVWLAVVLWKRADSATVSTVGAAAGVSVF